MSKAKNGEVLENFVLMLLYTLFSIWRVCWLGLRRIDFKNLNTLSFFLLINGIPLLVLFGDTTLSGSSKPLFTADGCACSDYAVCLWL